MVVQRQLASVEPDPAEELDLLCRATLDILTAQPHNRHHIDNGKQRRT